MDQVIIPHDTLCDRIEKYLVGSCYKFLWTLLC